MTTSRARPVMAEHQRGGGVTAVDSAEQIDALPAAFMKELARYGDRPREIISDWLDDVIAENRLGLDPGVTRDSLLDVLTADITEGCALALAETARKGLESWLSTGIYYELDAGVLDELVGSLTHPASTPEAGQ